jgi:hypothetical protein
MHAESSRWTSRTTRTLLPGCAASALLHLATIVGIASARGHRDPYHPDAQVDHILITGVGTSVDPLSARTSDDPGLSQQLARFAAGPRAARRPPDPHRRPLAPAAPQTRTVSAFAFTPIPSRDRAETNSWSHPSVPASITPPFQVSPSTANLTPAAMPPARTPPPPAMYVPASVAQSLRLDDPYPDLPDHMRGSRPLTALVEICVSDRGLVHQVTLDHAAPPALAQILTAAIRTWRYRPLIAQGHPQPFCHVMQISYL